MNNKITNNKIMNNIIIHNLEEKNNEGIIIRTIDYKENSKLIFIVTSGGLVSLEAKGANSLKSKNNSYTKVFTKINYNTRGHFITTGKVLENYNNIKLDVNKYALSSVLLEMSYTLIEHITDFKIFYNFLCEILLLINNNNEYDIYERIFRTKLLYLLGIAPILNKCVSCGKQNNLIGFSLEDGGMKCMDCTGSINKLIMGKQIEIFRKLYLTKLDKFYINDYQEYTLEDYKALDDFLDLYYSEYFGFVSKSRKILKEIK